VLLATESTEERGKNVEEWLKTGHRRVSGNDILDETMQQ
jgi:hypothetical protein